MRTLSDPPTTPCTQCGVLDCSILSNCPSELLDAVDAVKELVVIQKDGTLYEEGTPVAGLHCQVDGRFAMLRRSVGGDEHVVGIARPGHGHGAKELLQGARHEETAVALENSTVCFVPSRMFRSIVRDFPPVIVRVMEGVCQNLSDIEKQIERHELQSRRS